LSDRLLPFGNVLLRKAVNILKKLGVPNLLYNLLNFLSRHNKTTGCAISPHIRQQTLQHQYDW
jgi:hypothetical protein